MTTTLRARRGAWDRPVRLRARDRLLFRLRGLRGSRSRSPAEAALAPDAPLLVPGSYLVIRPAPRRSRHINFGAMAA